jgi:O-6-methylguanine DNA methyltransferase
MSNSNKDTIKTKLWQALLKIPFGQTVSYSQLANNMGMPKHTRYISSFLKENSLPISIPCHRVIRKSGEYGKFGLGKEFKVYLIEWESSFFNKKT